MFIDEKCKDCPYYYGEIDWCMVGEENVPDNLVRKCKKEMINKKYSREEEKR
jgi:hypothetical protein